MALKLRMTITVFVLAVLDRFPDKLGPETRATGQARQIGKIAPEIHSVGEFQKLSVMIFLVRIEN